jgi:diguanylate cyclase (GGDEF)-like protein
MRDLCPPRLLIVENDPALGDRHERLLAHRRTSRFEIERAATTAEAERRLQRWAADAILLGIASLDPSTAVAIHDLKRAAPDAAILLLCDDELDDSRDDAIDLWREADDVQPRRNLEPAPLVRAIRCAIERKRGERALVHLAAHDALTGLPNRLGFVTALGRAIERSQRSGLPLSVMFVDLDGFKRVNDALGHATGDRLLRLVAERLSRCLREGDTIARLGGDEFVVLADGLMTDEDSAIVAGRLCAAVAQPFDIEGNEANISASVGVALYPSDGNEVECLLRAADQAMYRAKRSGGNGFEFVEPEREGRLPTRLALETRLRRALSLREFDLCFQPEVELGTGRVVAVEALLRWRRESATHTPPETFIPLLEETGLILPVGEWVLKEACTQVARWREMGFDLHLAVNVSARQLRSPGFAETVARTLAATRFAPEWLELELTESMLIENTQAQRANLEALRATGVRISLDDFGTGYSSLSYLRHLPIDSLKMDRSFTADVARDGKARAIGKAIVQLAHSLDLRVVAEGVETPEQLSFLASHGCDVVQGFYVGRPMSSASLETWLDGQLRAIA